MLREVLKAKIHRATVTKADLNYTGSITIDADLLSQVDIIPYEKVQVYNITSGDRFETYVIEGAAGSGAIEVNGAAARLAQAGDRVIIVAFQYLEDDEARAVKPRLALVDEANRLVELMDA